MNFRKFWVPCICLALLAAGCAPTESTPEIPDTTAAETAAAAATEAAAAVSEAQPDTVRPTAAQPVTEAATEEPYTPVLPLISIQTAEEGAHALDFVTEPVAAHVSELIASWTPGYVFPPAPYYVPCTVTLTDTDSTVLLPAAEAEVKVRGNWTTMYDKKPLRIRFAEKQGMLGLHDGNAFRNWVLLAEYKDLSMLRNQTAMEISHAILDEDGLYAADAGLAEVEINGEYWGVYLVTEQQQVNENRVAVTKSEPDSTDTHIGYFMEMDGYYYIEEPLQQFRCEYADNAPLRPFEGDANSGRQVYPLNIGGYDIKQDTGITIKSTIESQEQHDFIASYVNNVYTILYAAAYNDEAWTFNETYTEITRSETLTPEEAVRQAIDVQSLADMYLIQEILCDADIYWSSFFMDVDFGEGGSCKLTFEAPWDFDSALGNKERCVNGQGFYAANIVPDVNDTYDTINPWLAVLMHEEWFQEIIREKWTKVYDTGVFDRTCEQIIADADACEAAFRRNYERWDNFHSEDVTGEMNSRTAACKNQREAAEYLADWLQKRVSFLNAYWHA